MQKNRIIILSIILTLVLLLFLPMNVVRADDVSNIELNVAVTNGNLLTGRPTLNTCFV
ncbi:hypothetical protein V7147_10285 [Bacillus sp. JJ1521]|uniref:hypothetical protein n=1 Tax=Bacillus sp. JJ1521 TaxID=3122957 RepID=UPI002FFE7588